MRVIKFRAWHKHEKRMYPVAGMLQDLIMLKVADDSLQGDSLQGAGIDDIELLQFTGLKDKSGKDIYDGDIVEIGNIYSEKHIAKVMWNKVTPMYTWMIGETWLLYFVNGEEGPLFPYCERRNGFEVSVIGNIYENSELVKS